MKQIIISLRMLGIMSLLLGLVYPLLITGIARAAFPDGADGSLVGVDDTLRGSRLIGQQMEGARWFHSRPSATDYNMLPSGASNLALTSRELHEVVEARRMKFIIDNGLEADAVVPAEMVFASASGLDPHISPAAARMQVGRIARARGFSRMQRQRLSDLVESMTERPQFEILGCARVNVFMLNLALDKLQ